MVFNHNGYLNYMLPNNWCAEENENNLILYNPNGNGAIITSFFSALDKKEFLDEQISILAGNFIEQNHIKLSSPPILFNRDSKTILYGTGTTSDDWFVKLWIVAKHPKIVLASYQSERNSDEVKKCDSIIESFQFIL